MGITFGKNDEGKATVTLGGQTALVSTLKDGYVSNYRKGVGISEQTGMALTYDESKGWVLNYNDGKGNQTVTVSTIGDKYVETFILFCILFSPLNLISIYSICFLFPALI